MVVVGRDVEVDVTSLQSDLVQTVDTSCLHCDSVQVCVVTEVVGFETGTVPMIGDVEADGDNGNDDDDN